MGCDTLKDGKGNIQPVPQDVRKNKKKESEIKIVKIRKIKSRKIMAVLRNTYK